MSVLQFVFLLVALVTLTMWLMSKVFVIACTNIEGTLKHVLLQIWQKNPDNLQRAMTWLMTQEEADEMVKSARSAIDQHNRVHLDALLKDADFVDGNCRHCGQPVPWSARSSELPPP